MSQFFLEYVQEFLHPLMLRLSEVGLDVRNYPIDHICFRPQTMEEYEIIKRQIMDISSAYIENLHNNRLNAKFILTTPIIFGSYTIPIIELPSPKLNQRVNGWDHIEFVVKNDYGILKERYAHVWTEIEQAGEHNTPLVIEFENGTSVKFHEHALEDVIRMEGNSFIPTTL